MDKEGFSLDKQAKKKINNDYARPDDLDRGRNRRPVRRPAPAPRRQAAPRRNTPVPPPRPTVRRQAPPPQYVPPVIPEYQPEYEPEYETGEKPPFFTKRRIAKWLFRTALFCIFLIFVNIVFLYFTGHLWFNQPIKREYPVRGAVVSEELGKIDWEKFSGSNISYVYIRATKGTTEIDKQYKTNRKGANHTKLLSGYYHDFDFRVDGKKQAEHFIEQMGSDLDGKLRPMVRVAKYGIYSVRMKDADEVEKQLQAFLDRINEEYGVDCVIQCDSACYKKYIKADFADYYSFWIMSHFSEPEEGMDWDMWEYNPRVRTSTYSNNKKYYSMSVYRRGRSLKTFKENFLV